MVDGSTHIANVWISSSQGTNWDEEIVVNVQLSNVHNGSGSHRRCTCSFITLNGTNRCSGTLSLAARIGKVLGSLKQSCANNTNVGGSSSYVGKDIGWLEVMGQSNVNCYVSNKMKHEGLDGAMVSTVEVAKKHSTKHQSLRKTPRMYIIWR